MRNDGSVIDQTLLSSSSSSSEDYEDLSYSTYFKNIECAILLISAGLSVVFSLYIDAILSVTLHT